MIDSVLIVSGGNVDIELLKQKINEYTKIIAVDKGLESLYKIDKNPDYIVGDFDSVDTKIIEFYKEKNIEIYGYSSEKDYTDTELGLNLAIDLSPKKIVIIGGIGTRIDHTLANIHIIKKCLEKNIECEIIDEHNKIYLINSFKQIEKVKAFRKVFFNYSTYKQGRRNNFKRL